MLKTYLEDGRGRGTRPSVEDNGLLVSTYPSPPLLPQKIRVFRQYLTDDGLTTGSNDMGIDASVTAVEFWVPAHATCDRYITALSFSMTTGSQPQFWEFADSAAALTNGCRLWYETGTTTIYIHDAMKTNWEFIRLCSGIPTISTGNLDDAFIVKNVGSAGDFGMIPFLHLAQFVPPYGIKLDLGSSQRLVFEVRDDCTDADVFNIIAYGFERFE